MKKPLENLLLNESCLSILCQYCVFCHRKMDQKFTRVQTAVTTTPVTVSYNGYMSLAWVAQSVSSFYIALSGTALLKSTELYILHEYTIVHPPVI